MSKIKTMSSHATETLPIPPVQTHYLNTVGSAEIQQVRKSNVRGCRLFPE